MRNYFYTRLKNSVKVFLGRADLVQYDRFACPVCGRHDVPFYPLHMHFLREMHKHQYIHPVFMTETINFEHYTCASCYASDRDRLYALYFEKRLKGSGGKLDLLDIAPSTALNRFLRRQPALRIRTADLYMDGVDDRVDLTKMDIYKDGQFDVFICSHVLEHIPDDIAAMKELYRVLKPGGWGIAMVPINLALNETYENASITDKAGRWKHFGQDDHVRMYSKDGFIKRLESVGFKVNQFDQQFFGEAIFRKHAIHPFSVLYIVEK